MLHQIRKMIGTAMAVARGHADESVFERAWSLNRIDLPMAPALGLLLHEVSYMTGEAPYCVHAGVKVVVLWGLGCMVTLTSLLTSFKRFVAIH